MRLGVVLVHFHTPELAVRAVRAVRQDAATSGFEIEVVVVDNGSTAAGRERLARLASDGSARLLEAGSNIGYAAGINLGVGALDDRADAFVAMNPDVRVLPGCLAAMCDALAAGAGVAGPRFFWDRKGGFLLPPTEQRGRRHSLRRFLAARRPAVAARARRAWRQHARRHWRAKEPLASHELSGALLAIDSAAWRQVGPLDSGFRLYFEETDWLERARRQGVGGLYVPAAKAIHAYAQSTPHEPRAASWFAASHARFRRRHYGTVFARALEAAARLWPEDGAEATPVSALGSVWEETRWLEVAASPLGFPAAARRVRGALEGGLLPPGADPGVYFVRAVGRHGRELAAARLEVALPGAPSGEV